MNESSLSQPQIPCLSLVPAPNLPPSPVTASNPLSLPGPSPNLPPLLGPHPKSLTSPWSKSRMSHLFVVPASNLPPLPGPSPKSFTPLRSKHKMSHLSLVSAPNLPSPPDPSPEYHLSLIQTLNLPSPLGPSFKSATSPWSQSQIFHSSLQPNAAQPSLCPVGLCWSQPGADSPGHPFPCSSYFPKQQGPDPSPGRLAARTRGGTGWHSSGTPGGWLRWHRLIAAPRSPSPAPSPAEPWPPASQPFPGNLIAAADELKMHFLPPCCKIFINVRREGSAGSQRPGRGGGARRGCGDVGKQGN